MPFISKRRKEILSKIDRNKIYSCDEAIELLKTLPGAKFKKSKESLDISVNLGVDPKQSDQVVRGATVMPNGTGKEVRVAVFAKGDKAEAAKAAGADIVGLDDLAEEIKGGNFNFDVVIASPDTMGVVGRLGQVLGPRGLMPNPKVGTVTADVATAVKNAKGGQARYRTDKNGIIHTAVGNVEMAVDKLAENIQAILADLRKAKPSSSKGVYFKKLTLSTTMGPGLIVDFGTLTF